MNNDVRDYTHLIVLKTPYGELQTKEFLDIALVSASYDAPVAIFFDSVVLPTLQQFSSIELVQAFNMIKEFEIPLFAAQTTTLFGQVVPYQSLAVLSDKSQHVLTF